MAPFPQRTAAPGAQRGVVLFIALIAMVVLSLAGVALIRAVDTSGSAAGNIAFREASVTAVNLAIEQAVDWLYVSKTLNPDTDVDNVHHYYGKLQPGELPNGLPAVLAGTYSVMKSAYPFGAGDSYTAFPTLPGSAEVRSVIERICSPAAPVPPAPGVLGFADKTQYCDSQPPKVSPAKTSMKLKGPTLPPIPLYRVTIRIDLPGTNTATYAQAMLH
jgi:type IV pilus assembly protein PilX